MRRSVWILILAMGMSSLALAQEDPFESLFNGKDLTGWVNVNCAPCTWTVKDGLLHCTGVPTGALRTEKQYENFILELEWRHLKPGGNAGVFLWAGPLTAPGTPFLRSIEVQILDHAYGKADWFTTHGDVFPIHGSTMTPFEPSRGSRSFPSEERSKGSPEWNHYRIHCEDGTLRLSVNGKEVSGGKDCNYRKGYIALESEGGMVDYRNIRIQELPSSQAGPEVTAPLARGFVPIYNGVDLDGWREEEGKEGHWKAADWRLSYDGKGSHLWTLQEYGDFELICDWRWTVKPVKKHVPLVLPDGSHELDENGEKKTVEIDDAGDSGIYLRGSSKSQVNIWCWPIGSGEVYGYRNDMTLSPEVRAGVTPRIRADKPIGEWNRFHIRLIGDRLSVTLNGEEVLKNAHLPGIPEKGPLVLQHHGDPLEFANLFILELNGASQ